MDSVDDRVLQLKSLQRRHEQLLEDLRSVVQCPVCYDTPRTLSVPCCRNGHVLCRSCERQCSLCPTCRVPLTNCVSRVAECILAHIQHSCTFKDSGCHHEATLSLMQTHERQCRYRCVPCPNVMCRVSILGHGLLDHILATDCGDNYQNISCPFQDEVVYHTSLDDNEGNGFWKPRLFQFDGVTFYFQMVKCGKTKTWYFYTQMDESEAEEKRYGTTINISKTRASECDFMVYSGPVCPIDIKGLDRVAVHGSTLAIKHTTMESTFNAAAEDAFTFWITVDFYRKDKHIQDPPPLV